MKATAIVMNDATIELNGLTVSTRAFNAALYLESIGVQLRADGDDLLISPQHVVPSKFIPALRELKTDLLAIARYCQEPPA